MRSLAVILIAACAACAACAQSTTAPDAGTADAGVPDSGRLLAAPLIEPSTYDCRSLAQGAPSRPAGALPLSCPWDAACNQRLVVGHRSAGGTGPGLGVLAPENTLSAVRAAIVMGLDFVETDPRSTKDGVIVNVHDPDISVSTHGTGQVSDLTWDEIRPLSLRYGETVVGDFSCDRVITIRELLLAAKGKINVLLDANKIGQSQVEALVALVEETDTFAEAVFDTSSLSKIAAARRRAPNLRVHIRPDTAGEIEQQIMEAAPVSIVELDPGDLTEGIPIVRRHPGLRVLTDSLGGFDLEMSASWPERPELMTLYEKGVDAVQTDRPDLVMRLLGRL